VLRRLARFRTSEEAFERLPRSTLERAPRYGQRVDQTVRRGCRAQSEETEVSVLTGGPEGHSAAHVFAANCDAHGPKPKSGACFASQLPQAAAGGLLCDRSHAAASRSAPVSSLAVTVAEAAARFQTGWSGGCLPNRLVVGRSQRRAGAEDAQRVVRRRLPWGSSPFDDKSSGDRYVGLPHRHRPSSGFFTLSTV
jgi:hypothetical protein